MEDYIRNARLEIERCADFLAVNPNINMVVTRTVIVDRSGFVTIPTKHKRDQNEQDPTIPA